MLIEKLLGMFEELGKEQFMLLVTVVNEDIKFHKGLGVSYTEESLMEVINNAYGVINRV